MSISINFRIFQDFSGFFRIFQDFSGFFRIFQEFLRICFAGGRKDAANMIAESVSLQDFGSGIFSPQDRQDRSGLPRVFALLKSLKRGCCDGLLFAYQLAGSFRIAPGFPLQDRQD